MVDKVQHSPIPPGAYSVLASSTFAFTVCFAAWMMFAVLGIPIKAQLGLNETQFGLLTAMPVLTGSLVRVPLGIWTDRFGGRIVLFLLMLSTVPAIWLMAYATEYWQFLLLSLFVGLAGGSLVPSRWARPMWRAGSRRTGRVWPWAFLAPETPVRP